MNNPNEKRGPPSFALVVVLGVALSGYAPTTKMATITYLTWWIGCEVHRSRGARGVSPKSVRLEDESGITPRMIEAGALQLKAFDGKFSSFEDGALNIYRAMLRAKTPPPLGRRLLSRDRQGKP